MKKDFIFAPIMIVIAVLLGLLKVTGMTAHIVISIVGVVALVVYTVVTKKEWKIPTLEIGMRVAYGLALITGIVLKIKYIAFVGTVHKIFAILFAVSLVVLFVHKLIVTKKK